MDNAVVVSIAVDQSVYQTDKPYDYIVPDFLVGRAVPGCRVLVPFGKGNSRKTGIILSFSKPDGSAKLKFVIAVLDEKPVLSEKMLSLAAFIKEQTFCTMFSAIRVLLPPGINYKVKTEYELTESADMLSAGLGEELGRAVAFMRSCAVPLEKDAILGALGLPPDSTVLERLVQKGIVSRTGTAVRNVGDAQLKMVRLTDAAENLSSFKLTAKQKETVAVLSDIGCCSVKELCYFTGNTAAVVNGLAKKGIAEIFDQEYYRNPYDGVTAKKTVVCDLTEEQKNAYDDLMSAYLSDKGETALLYGVTGSGKTQVFLKLCEEVSRSGRGVIVMVPEIALTPQTLGIFHRRFGDKVAVFHSAMSQGQRLDEWKRVSRGEATIALGTRSAVFAPFSNVGLIIMDEEQEHTYKSEMSPHFHARDVARFRIADSKGLLVLSSATPSIETFSRAKSGIYRMCRLSKRYGNAVLPSVETVDMREELAVGNKGAFSNRLYECVLEALRTGHQAILLLNRRGYNTYVSCPTCGNVISCDNCSISMTYHSANNRLMCHYCGKSLPYADKCPVCGSDNMRYSGIGTQKAEDELKSLFPEARILRMDADSTVTRSDYEKNLNAFAAGEYDILLGTQMVAKGLDFPKVTVVGVLNADSSLHSGDFRAYERTFSLLTQVVGRSGRGNDPGVALIQTSDPESTIISLAAKQDYDSFYETEIMTRKLMVYPPYCDIATVCFSSETRQLAENAANDFFARIKKAVSGDYGTVKVMLLGPTAAAVPKVNNNYRYKLIIKYKNSKLFREMMSSVFEDYQNGAYSKKVSAFIDVNPDSVI